MTVPLVTATLETAFQAGDAREAILSVADDIAVAMTLALGRDVRCVLCARTNDCGEYIDAVSRNQLVHPFNLGGHAVVDNWEPGILRPFIETACTEIAKERDWWHKTLGMYLLVQVNKYLEVKCAILHILVDRIAAKHSDAVGDAEIDPNLPARIDDGFKRRLHDLLTELSPHWGADRTNRLIETIKAWNATPSFSKRICRVCDKLRIPQPPERLLATRHRLLHSGDLDPREGTIGEYWTELEWPVLVTILRLLGYEGKMYHHKLGAHPTSAPLCRRCCNTRVYAFFPSLCGAPPSDQVFLGAMIFVGTRRSAYSSTCWGSGVEARRMRRTDPPSAGSTT
ncbi:MAG: hypothetical protein V1790_17310, partial [Planctomycetota bacterium]